MPNKGVHFTAAGLKRLVPDPPFIHGILGVEHGGSKGIRFILVDPFTKEVIATWPWFLLLKGETLTGEGFVLNLPVTADSVR